MDVKIRDDLQSIFHPRSEPCHYARYHISLYWLHFPLVFGQCFSPYEDLITKAGHKKRLKEK
jgi:hypothetical protein